MNVTIKEIWESVKSDYIFGKDYISLETDDYIIISPFSPYVISDFNASLAKNKSLFFFKHCICYSNCFKFWFRGLYRDGRIKTLFIRKDIDLYNKNAWSLTSEFTGWVDISDKHFLSFAHLLNNRVASGIYEWNDKLIENVLSHYVPNEYENEFAEICDVLEGIFDELVQLYDTYVDELEENLFNFLEE